MSKLFIMLMLFASTAFADDKSLIAKLWPSPEPTLTWISNEEVKTYAVLRANCPQDEVCIDIAKGPQAVNIQTETRKIRIEGDNVIIRGKE